MTLSALRARQCDGHTTRNSFDVELNFCLVGICMERPVSSFQSRKEFVTPSLAKRGLSSGPKPEYFKGGVAYIYICVCVYNVPQQVLPNEDLEQAHTTKSFDHGMGDSGTPQLRHAARLPGSHALAPVRPPACSMVRGLPKNLIPIRL